MVQIVIGGKSSRVRKQALRDPKYVLKDRLLEARREEVSTSQAADIEEHLDSHNIQAVKNAYHERRHPISDVFIVAAATLTNKPCPAKNKTSANCGKLNYSANQCHSRNTRENRQTGKTREVLQRVKTGDDNALAATAVVQNIGMVLTTSKNTRKRQFVSIDNG